MLPPAPDPVAGFIDVVTVAARLKARYGYAADQPNVFNTDAAMVAGPESEPLDGLLETILSQQSPVAATQRMADALRRAFPDWSQALAAGAAGIQTVLQAARGNLANAKAGYIHRVLSRLQAERGSLSLQFLRTWAPAEARKFLLSLPGVGPKTASCVLLFNLQLPAQPVDTHLLRIAQRLGFVGETAKPGDAETWFEHRLPPTWEAHYEFHLNGIVHGQQTCKAQRPRCGECVLQEECPSAGLGVVVQN